MTIVLIFAFLITSPFWIGPMLALGAALLLLFFGLLAVVAGVVTFCVVIAWGLITAPFRYISRRRRHSAQARELAEAIGRHFPGKR